MSFSDQELEDLLFDPNVSDIELEAEEDESEINEECPIEEVEEVDDLDSTEIDQPPTASSEVEQPPTASTSRDRADPNRWRHKIAFDGPLVVDASGAHDYVEVGKPMEYFNRYLDWSFFVESAEFTNRRSVEELGKSLDTTAEEMSKFWGASIVAALLQYPRLRMCWESRTRYPLISDNISRDRFFSIRNKMKVVDDNSVSLAEKASNPYWKVQPMIDKVRKGCLENVRPQNISVDEQMIPFHGKVRTRQYVRGKPNPVGIKNFVATSSSGLPLDFILYGGKGAEIISEKIPLPEKIDLGGRVVLKLSDSLPECSSLFFDRYFTSITLLESLLVHRNIYGTGTLMFNRLPKNVNFISDREMKKNRGSFDQVVRADKKISLVKWFDNRSIFLGSTMFGAEPVEDCRRWSKKDGVYIQIPRPFQIKMYNMYMGGVDMLDRVIGKYSMRARTKKWTIRVIHHFFDFACAAAWIKYRAEAAECGFLKKDILTYYFFKLTIAENLLYPSNTGISEEPVSASDEDDEERREAPGTSKRRASAPLPPPSKRVAQACHMPEVMCGAQKNRSRCRLPGCSKLTFIKCTGCDVFLCITTDRNCFKNFHKK